MVALYLYLLRPSPDVTALVLIALAILVFVPIRYVYPSRTRTLFVPTMVLGSSWAVLIGILVWRLPATDGPWLMLSMIFPVYYVALSLWLSACSLARAKALPSARQASEAPGTPPT